MLADALRVNDTIAELDLGGENGSMDALLASALRSNATLAVLSLWGCNIGKVGAILLADVLYVNSTLTDLDLGGNKIGALGLTSLAAIKSVNPIHITIDSKWSRNPRRWTDQYQISAIQTLNWS